MWAWNILQQVDAGFDVWISLYTNAGMLIPLMGIDTEQARKGSPFLLP
jgi:hypothetical protein